MKQEKIIKISFQYGKKVNNLNQITKKFIEYQAKRLKDNEYFCTSFWSDKERDKVIDIFYKKNEIDYEKINNYIIKYNIDTHYAAGYMVNPTYKNERSYKAVNRILNIPIDIDKGNQQEKYDKVNKFLEKNNIKTSLIDKSQNGFHFIIPVELNNNDTPIVEKFIKLLNQNVHKDIDKKMFDAPRFFRLPETLNNKSESPTPLETLHFEDLTQEQIEQNTINVRHYVESNELEEKIYIHQEENQTEPDIFFEKLLRNDTIKKYIANRDNIEKNNILFKNLAIYTKFHSDIEELAYDFIKQCGHSEGEFYGWVKKDMMIVNYKELKLWIYEHNLEDLKPLIREQMKLNLKYLDNFKICYLTQDKSHRYMLYDKRNSSYTKNTDKQLIESLKFKSNEDGYDIYEELEIYDKYTEDGKPLSMQQLNNRLLNKLLTKFDETDILQTIYDFGYKPVIERFFSEGDKKYFNIYTPGELEYFFEDKPINQYEFPNVKKILKHLTVTEEGYEYFNKWLGFILQNPTTKLPTSIIFKGTQGIGKGRLREWILPYIFGNHNIEEINDSNLKNQWGDYIKNNRIVVANEINLLDSASNSAYKRIKEYSTDKKVSIQQKGKQLEKISNYTHWIFFSDQEMPIRIDSEDRRHTIFHQEDKLPINIVMALSPDINPGQLKKEMKEYVSYLRKIEVKFEDVVTYLPTQDKIDLINMSKDTIDLFMAEITETDNFEYFVLEYNPEYKLYPEKIEHINSFIEVKDFYDLYVKWCIKNHHKYPKSSITLGKKLSKEYKINSIQKKVKNINKRVYEVLENRNIYI